MRYEYDEILHELPENGGAYVSLGIEKMLRMYLLQVWFNLSDEGVEDTIFHSYAFRKFMGINFNEEQVPDATTLLKFRHLLEENHLGEQMFKAINCVLEQGGAMMEV